jgi:hypothetical protein
MKLKIYQLKPHGSKSRKYFLEKYGTETPDFELEGTDVQVMGRPWTVANNNPAALLYAMRSGLDHIPFGGKVYYGKVGVLGELVHESELGDEKNEGGRG